MNLRRLAAVCRNCAQNYFDVADIDLVDAQCCVAGTLDISNL